jgi:hypothetical protein
MTQIKIATGGNQGNEVPAAETKSSLSLFPSVIPANFGFSSPPSTILILSGVNS